MLLDCSCTHVREWSRAEGLFDKVGRTCPDSFRAGFVPWLYMRQLSYNKICWKIEPLLMSEWVCRYRDESVGYHVYNKIRKRIADKNGAMKRLLQRVRLSYQKTLEGRRKLLNSTWQRPALMRKPTTVASDLHEAGLMRCIYAGGNRKTEKHLILMLSIPVIGVGEKYGWSPEGPLYTQAVYLWRGRHKELALYSADLSQG